MPAAPRVTVERVRARYRVPAGDAGTARRLDGVVRRALDRPLERALERAGFAADALLYVRRLHVPVRLDLSRADEALEAAWAEAVAGAVRAARDAGDAVLYPHRAAALADLASRALTGDDGRAWVWRALGLWPDGPGVGRAGSAEAVAAALAREPGLLPAQLGALAAQGRPFDLLVRTLPPARWTALAAAAARALGGRERLPGPGGAGPAAALPRHRDGAGAAFRSHVARAAGRLAPLPPETARALALLALLESEPGAARDGAEQAAGAAALAASWQAGDGWCDVAAENGAAAEARTDSLPGGAPADAPPPTERRRARPDAATAPDAGAGEGDPGPLPAGAVSADEAAAAASRTRHGGLLFLLHVVAELELHERLPREEALRGWGLRACLHALGRRLAPMAADDPAALAFCGLPPDTDPPVTAERPAGPDAHAALDAAARAVRKATAERLARPDGRPGPSLPEVVAREAEVVADPGWIDVRFPMRGLSPDVRRAGLDLDPGWLPWLGTVVRFVYV